MDKLTFTCDYNSRGKTDFYITYDPKCWNWNDYGYFIRYLIYATPKITPNKKLVLLGKIRILDKNQLTKPHWLEDRLKGNGKYDLFYELPETFSSCLLKDTAIKLWMLLDNEQREEFVEAMHVVDPEGTFDMVLCRDISSSDIDVVNKLLFSEIDIQTIKESYLQLYN